MAYQDIDTTGNESNDVTLAKIKQMLEELYALTADYEARIAILENA